MGSSCRGEVVVELLGAQERVEFAAGRLMPYNCCIRLIISSLPPQEGLRFGVLQPAFGWGGPWA